jgi:hypothetical protein
LITFPDGDLVIDANILNHACSPSCDYFDTALAILIELLASEVKLALDDTGKDSPNAWTSNLYREYTECIPPLSVAANVIATLLAGDRVNFYLRPQREVWQKCKQLTPQNNNDAIVLGVGVCCTSNTVVSNDYKDFSARTRARAKRLVGVVIQDSDEFAA